MNPTYDEILLQWNTRSLISHWAEFRDYMVNKKPLLAAIQETWFKDSDFTNYTLTLSGYSLYTDNINETPRRGGAALYVSNNLLHHQVTLNSTLNHVAVNVKIAQLEITVVSLYLSPNEQITKPELQNFINLLPSPFLILGDLNAQHPAWGCNNTNTRGNYIHQIINDNNILFLNDMTPTHLFTRDGQIGYSVIDLAISSPSLATLFNFEVQPDPLFSDHYPIHLSLNIPSGQTNFNFLPRWNLRKADWTSFQFYIDETHPLNSSPDLQTFLNTILASAQNNIPLTHPPNPRQKHSPWWNDECQKAVAKRKRALRQFQRCICREHEEAARRARTESKEIILRVKKEKWESFSNNFNRFTPLSKIWSMIKCFSTKSPNYYKVPHLVINNIHYSVPFDVATQFALHYASVSSRLQYPTHIKNALAEQLDRCNFESPNTEIYNLPFTKSELSYALSKCGNTSVGPDQLAYSFFQNLTETGRNNLLSGLNEIWVNGTFPDTWRHSTLIPILKPRKPPFDPSSYRPISLSSCASKIFERMVNGRLRGYIESNEILSPYQNGFRPGRSTADSLVHLIDSIQRGFQTKQITLTLFLDLKAAFDKVNHSALLIKLHKIGIKGRLAKFIINFISNRTFSVRCGNTTAHPIKQDNGVPQGCVISPTLFLILIDDICHNVNNISPNIKFSLYADDVAIWLTHPNVDEANRLIQLALDQIQHWCDQWGLQISPKKSATLIFSKLPRHITPLHPLKLNREVIPIVKTFKYLGITLDRQLTFTPHISDIIQRCARRLNIMKCISGRDWGADRRTLLRLYTSLIRPILDYNAFLFDTISPTNIGRIEAIQNNALRIICGAFKTTPTKNLNIETNIPSLHHRRKYQLLRFFIRAQSRPNHPTAQILTNLPRNQNYTTAQKRHPTISMRIKEVQNLFQYKIPELIPAPRLRAYWTDPEIISFLFTESKKHINNYDIQTKFIEFKQQYPNHTFIYTDGSHAEGRTGSAWASGTLIGSHRLHDLFTVFSAELDAIRSSLLLIKRQNIKQAVICTDSSSSLHAIKSISSMSHPIVSHIRRLLAFLHSFHVIFLWIPGHVGIPGNEIADQAAKETLIHPEQNHLKCPSSDILSHVRSYFVKFLQRIWDNDGHFHFSDIKPKLGHWPSAHQNSRLKEILLARLRLGHTKLTHLYIIEKTDPPICQRCNVRFNIPHFLLHCPQYELHRRPIIRYADANRLPLTLPTLLGDSYPELLALLFEFLHKTQLEIFI